MSYPLSEYLEVATPHLSSVLVPPSALAQHRQIARLVSMASSCGFECRLAEGVEPIADFALALTAAAAAERRYPSWPKVDAVCAGMADADLELGRDGGRVWLEFDAQAGGADIAEPGVFVLLNKARPAARKGMSEVLARTLDATTAAAVEPTLDALMTVLPPAARVHFIGAFPSRNPRLVNLNVGGLAPAEIAPFLAAMGWRGPADEVAQLAARLSPLVDRIGVSFNLDGGVQDRVGLECFIDRSPRVDPRWRAFLDALARGGLCAPAKRDALLAWHGFSQVDPEGALAETTLAQIVGRLGPNMVGAFARHVNHVKVVHQAGRPLEAKAYLAVSHFIKPLPASARSRREAEIRAS